MVWACDFLIGRKCCNLHVSHRFAWLGVFWFMCYLSLAVFGCFLTSNQYFETEEDFLTIARFHIWFIFCSIFRLFDLFNSFITAIRRRIHPRKRANIIIFSIVTRILTFFGEFALTIAGIVLLTEGSPPFLAKGELPFAMLKIAFYTNFVAMAVFYGFILSPCGIAIICTYCFCSKSSREEDEERFDHRHYRRERAAEASAAVAQVPEQEAAAARQAPRQQAPQPPQQAAGGWINFIKNIAMADIMGPDEVECSICLSAYDDEKPISQLSCGHYFHSECLLSYYLIDNRQKICLVCRQPVDKAKDLHSEN